MKKLFLLSVAATLISSLSFATIRRVNYPGTYLAGVDYATIDEANGEANDGDTLQIYGGTGGSITKRLIIIGFGYNFDANTGLQAIGTDQPSSANLNFHEGSSGSIVNGIYGGMNIYPYNPTTGASDGTGVSDITFTRCMLSLSLSNYGSYGTISNIKIHSSVLTGGGMGYVSISDNPVTNLQIYNCIIQGYFQMYMPGSTVSVINCVTPPNVNSYLVMNDAGALIKNSIIDYAYLSNSTNTIYENNFFREAEPTTVIPGSNNRWGQDWANIFTRNGSNDDEQSYIGGSGLFDEDYYVLKAGSPAINGGFNAANQPTNCGIYGGEAAYVYKVSGVPAIPAIYQLTAPTLNASTNPYNVTISVRSNN